LTDDNPWMRYEVPGSARATVVIKPAVIASLLKRAKHPLIVVAHGIGTPDTGSENAVSIIIDIAGSTCTPVIATPSAVPSLRKKGYSPVKVLSLMETGARLNDPCWNATGAPEGHDLVLFIGIPYGTGWLLQAGLKSFAPGKMRIISIDRHYQPHCNLSFPNLSPQAWEEQLSDIAREVHQE
jgi:CO dehydrogenase/acetyl-CoA synthase complex epsilon subunit